jgi:hypothetical protein
MYNEVPTQWFSQCVLTYKDKSYHSDGNIRISYLTSTQDYKYYTPPTFSINVSNNLQKNFNLNIQDSIELVKSFEDALQALQSSEKVEIQRKDSRNNLIDFSFHSGIGRIVVITIMSSETDMVKVIIPLKPVFEVVARALRYFVQNYFSICQNLMMKTMDSDLHVLAGQIPHLIKGISAQISIPDISHPVEKFEEVEKTEVNINDLDKFLGENMKNINIPELDEPKKEEPVILEVDSIFVKNVLKNDLQNLEVMLNNHSLESAPFISLANEIKEKMNLQDEKFTTLPGISENEIKSLVYLTKLFYLMSYHKYFYDNNPIPSGTPVFRYDSKNSSSYNIDLAVDLLLFSGYVRTLRRRLEDKIQDSIENKAMFHFQFRCFLDPLIFSFFKDMVNISSLCQTRFKYYEKIGVFRKYQEMLEFNRCTSIGVDDIRSYIDEVIKKATESPNIITLHDETAKRNGLKFTSKDMFSLEQINNEIIPLELAVQKGKDLNDVTFLEGIKKEHNLSNEIIAFFLKGKKISEKSTEPKERESNLERFVRTYKSEIPPQHQESFQNYVKEFGNKTFDFTSAPFPMDEFGDNIIKGLYNWIPDTDEKIAINYKYFFEKFESEVMTKEFILGTALNVPSSQSDWDILTE